MKPSFLLFGAAAFVLLGCNRNELDVDISNIQTAPIKVLRLDQDLFSLNARDFDAKSATLKARYGIYYEHYLTGFLNRRGSGDSLYQPSVLSFIQDRDIRETQQYVEKLYPDEKINALATQVNDCIKRFAFHFPHRPRPVKLVTCLSGWHYSVASLDSALVLALDMYLGDTARFYEMLRLPAYQVRIMNEHYILPDLTRGWLLTEFDTTLANTLLAHTIFYGKLLYATNALVPQLHDSLIVEYTGKQLDYCHTYEKKLWGYFSEKNKLFENSLQNVRELTSEGPFSGAISKECPPRIAMWVGWQIVKSYKKHNKQVTLEELMRTDDATILNKSKYRP